MNIVMSKLSVIDWIKLKPNFIQIEKDINPEIKFLLKIIHYISYFIQNKIILNQRIKKNKGMMLYLFNLSIKSRKVKIKKVF